MNKQFIKLTPKKTVSKVMAGFHKQIADLKQIEIDAAQEADAASKRLEQAAADNKAAHAKYQEAAAIRAKLEALATA